MNGMRDLNLDEDKRSITLASDVDTPNTSKRDHGVTAGPPTASSSVSRSLSSGQLPKPRDSMVKSLSRRREPPVVRQTKTSSIRLGIGKKSWSSTEKSKQETGDTQVPQILQDSVSPTPDNDATHLRTQSRGRYGVTPRGSPYAMTSRSHPIQGQTSSSEEHNSPSRISSGETDKRSVNTSMDQARRKSSIPLPARLAQQPSKVAKQHTTTSARNSSNDFPAALEADEYDRQKYSPESSFLLSQPSMAELAGSEVPGSRADIVKHQSEKLSAKEMLSSPLPEDLSGFDSDGPLASTRGYDEHGGFRIKKLRNTSKDGPILRITDSASNILLGDDQVSPPSDGQGSLIDESDSRELVKETSNYIASRRLSITRDSKETSPIMIKSYDDEETQQLIPDSAWQSNTSDSRFSTTSSSGTIKKTPDHGDHVKEEAGHDGGPEKGRASTERRSDTYNHGDWPGKDFAQFKQPSTTFPALPNEPSSVAEVKEGTELDQPPLTASSASRRSTIVKRSAPSKEISPFLYQNPNDGQPNQEQYLNDYVSHTAASNATGSSRSKVNFPPRSSSRKPKPPPIIVSAPGTSKSKSVAIKAAERAHAIPAESLGQPKNVKTFSQSISPGIANKPRVASKPQYSPSSTNKVMSNIRGLFHKRSIDSAPDRTGLSLRRGPSIPDSRNQVPGNGSRKVILTDMSRDQANANANARIVGNLVIPPSNGETQSDGQKSMRSKFRIPFASPVTPFTAGITTADVGSTRSTPTMPQALSSPSNHDSVTTPSLHSATSLTHHLLSMARVETVLSRKERMIDLSKAMVEVVGAARDAEKAMEQAKVEAARAEMAHLRVLSAVSCLEGMVRDIVAGSVAQDGAKNHK